MNKFRLKEEDFDGEINGAKCVLISLTNAKGTLVQISNFGARVVSFITRNKKGEYYDIVLGYKDLEGYKNSNERYYNAVIGRYAGRIAEGKFSLGGKDFSLSINNPPNHLHGGFKGLHEQVWKVEDYCSSSVELSCFLASGEDGYPGDFEIRVRYTLTLDNALMFEAHAICSEPSIINITNHAFFNIGNNKDNILDNKLYINAARYLPVDKNLIPTGEMLPVKQTPFDFTSFKQIGAQINEDNEQLKSCAGYDHSFVCDDYTGRNLFLGAAVLNPKSGLKLEIMTNQPSVHFYSCNFLDGKDIGKGEVAYVKQNAFCLETQHFPDSPNRAEFPSTVIKPGGEFTCLSVYKISDI